jgi:hypothetical protein
MDSVRRIEKLPVAAVRRSAGDAAQIVIDDRIVPLIGLSSDLPEEEIAMFRVGDGKEQIALAYERMVDLVEFDPLSVIESKAGSGERLVLVDGRPVELLDAGKLQAASGNYAVEGV